MQTEIILVYKSTCFIFRCASEQWQIVLSTALTTNAFLIPLASTRIVLVTSLIVTEYHLIGYMITASNLNIFTQYHISLPRVEEKADKHAHNFL